MFEFNSLCVVGLGYIGLPTAVVFADHGIQVTGVDISQDAVDSINQGRPHIVEPGLDAMLQKVVATGNLRASTETVAADAYILALPTPFKEGHKADLSYVEAGCRTIAPHLVAGNLVILESTSPVGATEQVSEWLAALRPDLSFPHISGSDADISVAHCPERVLPGQILREVVENDRVIGGISTRCGEAAAALYGKFVRGAVHICGARAAEMSKLTENAFRDVNIAFANELSIICEKLGIDVWELIALANLHPRVNILKPGPGVGGHCIAVDPWFIIAACPEDSKLMHAARLVNDGKPRHIVRQVMDKLAGKSDAKIACLGLAYKADVDDLRESPAVAIVAELARLRAGKMYAVEPNVDALPTSLSTAGVHLATLDEALADADLVLLLVDHREFLEAERDAFGSALVIDTRGVL